MRPAFIPVGQIVNAHGIRGEVKVNPHGFDPEFLTEFDTIYIDGQPVRVRSARVHKSTVLMALPGVDDMDAALALKAKPCPSAAPMPTCPRGSISTRSWWACGSSTAPPAARSVSSTGS